MSCFPRFVRSFWAQTLLWILFVAAPISPVLAIETVASVHRGDQIFLLSVRNQPSGLCSVRVPVKPQVHRLDSCGRRSKSSMDDYRTAISSNRATVIYVHGNRYTSSDAIEYGMFVYRKTSRKVSEAINWVIWSWPADRQGILAADVREKAKRTDGQAFLLASLLGEHVQAKTPTTLIGFSFGGRVITGALHAMAGGSLRGIVMNADPSTGGNFDVGLVAPAIEQHWLADHGYHRLATKNMRRLTLLYNRRDAVLKRYWLIDRVRGQIALGYSGPRTFATRNDGSKLPLRSRDCSSIVGLQHDETDYYGTSCQGEKEMALLIRDTLADRSPPATQGNVLFRRPMLMQSQP